MDFCTNINIFYYFYTLPFSAEFVGMLGFHINDIGRIIHMSHPEIHISDP